MNVCTIYGCPERPYDGDPHGLCFRHTSTIYDRNKRCPEGWHTYNSGCYAKVLTSGARRCVHICDDCGHLLHDGVAKCPDNDTHRVVSDTGTGWRDTHPCERCGGTSGVELHHWAPRALFEDADDWPQSWLCPACHHRWHHITRTDRRQDDAA